MRFASALLLSLFAVAGSSSALEPRYRVVSPPLNQYELVRKIERVHGELILLTNEARINLTTGVRQSYTNMSTPPGFLFYVLDLNTEGQILGQRYDTLDVGVLSDSGFMSYPTLGPVGYGDLEAINDLGVAVGSSINSGSQRAMMSSPAGALDLNTQVIGSAPILSKATLINDLGTIVAEARIDGSTINHILLPQAGGGYTVTPVTLPPGTSPYPIEMYVSSLNDSNVAAIQIIHHVPGNTASAAIIKDLNQNGSSVLAPPLDWMARGENFSPTFISNDGVVVGSSWSSAGSAITPAQYTVTTGSYRHLDDLTNMNAELLSSVHAVTEDGSALLAHIDLDRLGLDPDSPYPWRILIRTCGHDFNGTGTTEVGDIFSYLNAFFGQDNKADVNNDGVIAVQDIFDLLNSYFTAPAQC